MNLNLPTCVGVRPEDGTLAGTGPSRDGEAGMKAHVRPTTRSLTGAGRPGRLVSVLEGGYNLEALAASVEAHIRALEE